MSSVKLIKFVRDNDFSTQKQRGRYTATVNVPADTYGFVTIFQTVIPIPEEVACIENVTMQTSFTGDAVYSTSSLVYDYGDWRVQYIVYQADPAYYVLRAIVVCPSGSANVPANSASTVINMSLSPFVEG